MLHFMEFQEIMFFKKPWIKIFPSDDIAGLGRLRGPSVATRKALRVVSKIDREPESFILPPAAPKSH